MYGLADGWIQGSVASGHKITEALKMYVFRCLPFIPSSLDPVVLSNNSEMALEMPKPKQPFITWRSGCGSLVAENAVCVVKTYTVCTFLEDSSTTRDIATMQSDTGREE